MFIGSQCASNLIMCANSATRNKKTKIISNIRNKTPNLNSQSLKEIFYDVWLCESGSYIFNSIIEETIYRTIYRIIFKEQSDLTAIHKGYCNSGRETGIQMCSSRFGESYPCSALMNSFGPCTNDENFNDGL